MKRIPLRWIDIQLDAGANALSSFDDARAVGVRRACERYGAPASAASHGRALRTVADRLLSVACTLLEQQTLFDPSYEVRDAAGA
jgi:hypothetical protein